MKKWNIGIVSTDYDLKEERRYIASLLDQYNEINVLAFERPDYPVDPYVHSHDACLNVVDLMDIAFVIINRRYGGMYIGDQAISITFAEIQKLYNQNKIVIPIVNLKTWNERYRFFRTFKESNKELNEFIKEYKFEYVDDYRVIELVEQIHKSVRDNFFVFYDSVLDLEEKVKGRLRGLTRYFCQIILKKQIDEVKSKKTFLSLNQSLGDMFNKDLYISPDATILAGETIEDDLDKCILQNLTYNRKTLILGEPGSGKSTLMSKIFLEIANDIKNKSCVPIFIQLKGKKKNDSFSVAEFYRECFEAYFNRPLFPFCDFNSIDFWVFLDGLDEIGENLDSFDIAKLSDVELFKYPVLLTCREKYAYNYFESTVLGSRFSHVILIKKWTNKKAQQYIKKYAKNLPVNIRENVLRVSKSSEMLKMLDNPLITNLILFTISEGNLSVPFSFKDQADSLRYAIEIIANREIERNSYCLTLENYLFIWMHISWRLYRSREENSSVYLSDLIDYILSIYPSVSEKQATNIILSIFETNIVRKTITGCIHEQIMEYLVANFLISAVFHQTYPYPFFLKLVIRPEINHLFVARYNSMSAIEKDRIFDNLFLQYKQTILSNTEDDIMTRIRIIYYLTRIKNKKRDELISFFNRVENNELVRISMFSGCVKYGDLNLEELFYNELVSKPDFESLYMGYHLVYYNDVDDTQIRFPYYDDPRYEWGRTFSALFKQFSNPNKEYFYMTRIELYIIKRFMESRLSVGPVTKVAIKQMKKLIGTVDDFNGEKEYHQKIIRELNDLENTFDRLKKR